MSLRHALFTHHRAKLVLYIVLLCLFFIADILSGIHGCVQGGECPLLTTSVSELYGALFTPQRRYPPRCLIIGARKSGTRALLQFMTLHPKVVMAPQELHFFNQKQIYDRGVDWYTDQMPLSTASQLVIEKTPGYFVSPEAPDRVFAYNPSMKLLLIVRDPVTRTISDYTQVHHSKLAKGKPHEPLEVAMLGADGRINPAYKPIRNSLYADHVQQWLRLFPLADRLHIVDGDQLIRDPLAELTKIETFLHLPHVISANSFYYNASKGFYCYRHPVDGPTCLGSSKGRPHVNVSAVAREQLRRFFKPYNERFFRIVNRTFSW